MRLTREENREALKRYRHLKPVRRRAERCGRRLERSKRTCTLGKGHRGPHAAHGLFGRVLAVWGSGDGSAGSPGAGRSSTRAGRGSTGPGRRVAPRRPVGLRSRDPGGVLERVRSAAAWVDEHAEEILLLSFFAAFVWFAIDWLLIIFR